MPKTKPKPDMHWLSDMDYAKAVGQLRMQMGVILDSTFHMYGMDIYVPGATNAMVDLAEAFALRVRGVDKPITTNYSAPYLPYHPPV